MRADSIPPSVRTLDRRTVLRGIALTVLGACLDAHAALADGDRHVAKLRRIEQTARGRLGAYVLDTQSNTGFGWRDAERFAHCSSFKLSLAAMVLRTADRGEVNLGEVLRWRAEDMLPVSPETTANLERGL